MNGSLDDLAFYSDDDDDDSNKNNTITSDNETNFF